jgi:methionyl-tRNA formyltransferase
VREGLPVLQTSSLKGQEAAERIRAAQPDAMALAAFAAIVPPSVLDIAPILNVHPSLLPRWRGSAPIQSALLAGDAETGVSIIRLVARMDAGPILLQERIPIAADDDYLSLEPRLAELGADLLVRALAEWPAEREQDESTATFTRKIEREDGRIDWSRPAGEIWNQVRAYRGWPQAFTSFDGKLLKVLRATPVAIEAEPGVVMPSLVVGTSKGALRLDHVVLEGRRPQTGADFLRGYPGVVGSRLT